MRMLIDKNALSPVVATIILCGVVLILGISVWSLSYSISRSMQESYYENVKRQIDAVSERFTVEHVAYDGSNLKVWVYNYGQVSIEVDVYVRGDAEGSEIGPATVPSEGVAEIAVLIGSLSPGNELVVEVLSRRQNVVYQKYVVPAL